MNEFEQDHAQDLDELSKAIDCCSSQITQQIEDRQTLLIRLDQIKDFLVRQLEKLTDMDVRHAQHLLMEVEHMPDYSEMPDD